MSPEDRIEQILDDALLQVERGADNATAKLVKDIEKYLATFPMSGGAFVLDDVAVQMLSQLDVIIANAINSSAYPASVANVVRSIDEITSLSQQVLTNYNPKVKIDFDKLGVSQVRIAQVESIVNNMTGDSLTVNVRQGIREGLQRNVFAGAKLTDTRDFIAEYLTKQKGDKYARLTRYAMTWAQDGILQYDGQIYDRFRQEYPPSHIRYIGSLIADSRPQCVRWINKYDGLIPVDKLQSEIQWAVTSGSGMNLATTPQSFCTYRGGYRCRHKAIPVADIENVDE